MAVRFAVAADSGAEDKGKGGFGLGLSLEPDPKPDFLLSADNLMLGYGALYPKSPLVGESPVECGQDFQWQGANVYNPVP